MKTIVLLIMSLVSSALAQSSAFTYQGRLNHAGAPATGLYEISFALYDSATNGNTVSTPLTLAPVPVTNGLFSATLDFGSTAFTGSNRWLEISVTVFGSDQPVVTLTPRQSLTATPYALHANNAANLMSFVNAPLDIKVNGRRALRLESAGFGAPNVVGGSEANLVMPGAVGATIAGGGALNYAGFVSSNHVGSDFGTVGGGGQNSSIGVAATVAGGWNNVSSGIYSTIGGGRGNLSSNAFATVSGGDGNISEKNYATVGGGGVNTSSGEYATVGGGFWNSSTSGGATIAGGERNTASGFGASVGGGRNNTNSAVYGTIAGGLFNEAGSDYVTVAGGIGNFGNGESAVISGGHGNITSNRWAIIPGGLQNIAAGEVSFAAGRRAHALHDGSFVWADSDPVAGGLGNIFASTGNDQFLVRAHGGMGINTNDPAGAALSVAGSVRATSFEGGGGPLTFNSTDAQPLEFKLNGERVLLLEPTGGSPNVIGGSSANFASLGVVGGFIGGGENNSIEPSIPGHDFVTTVFGFSQDVTIAGGMKNQAAGSVATIGGGRANLVRGAGGTIAGGSGNIISLGIDMLPYAFTHTASTIGGGEYNTISNSLYCTIGGGVGNTSSGLGTAIGGGYYNSAQGDYGTVVGGYLNSAGGTYSLAAGRRAKADHSGALVLADSNDVDFSSSTNDEFSVRATGGVRFVTAIDTNTPTAGVSLAPGSGTWSSLSDRNAKENFTPTQSRQVLDKVAALPIATWNYKSQNESIRHIGPTAQDFHAAFNVGENDRTITTVDADGVALAAIQGLNQKLDEQLKAKDAEIQELRAAVRDLKQWINSISQTQNGTQ